MADAWGVFTKFGISASGAADTLFDHAEVTGGLVEDVVDNPGMHGTYDEPGERVRIGVGRVRLGITLPSPNKAELVALLPWILGGTGASPFVVGDAPPGRDVQVDKVETSPIYNGCKVNNCRFTASRGTNLAMALDVVGLDEDNGGTAFPSLSLNVATSPWIFEDLAISIAGSTRDLLDFDLSVDWALDTEAFRNATRLDRVVAMRRTILLTLNAPYSDQEALYGLAAGGVAVTATFTNGSNVAAFTMPKVIFPKQSPQLRGRSEIAVPLVGVVKRSGSTASLTVTIT